MKAAPPAISFPAFTIGEVCLSCFLHTMCISFILLLQDAHLSVPISPDPRNFSILCFFIILDPMNGNLLISSILSITPLHFLQDQCLSFFLRANFFCEINSRTSWARIYLTLIHMNAWHWKYINLPIN